MFFFICNHLNWRTLSHVDRLRAENPIPIVVRDVVLQAQIAETVNPGVRASNCSISQSFLLPELSVIRLIAEVSFGSFICLDVVLVAARTAALPRAPRLVDYLQKEEIRGIFVRA